MTNHVLDRPAWTALSTRQTAHAIGGERARSFAPDIGPLAGARDDENESLAELTSIIPEQGMLLLLQADPIVIGPDARTLSTAIGVQMIASGAVARIPFDVPHQRLDTTHFAAMRELATLTKPGPFAARTPVLGEFWGVIENGKLLAMAGERMRQPGFTEVSGVCVHPEARGRGLARALSSLVASAIIARGEVPYLHAYANNTSAITLYESLGFRVRCNVHVATIARA